MGDEKDKVTIGFDSPEEISLLNELVEHFPAEREENPSLLNFMAQSCLRYRRYDMPSALKRLRKYLEWRKNQFGNLADQTVEGCSRLQEQIKASFIYISPQRLDNGSALVFIRMRHHDPKEFDHKFTVKYWHYMMMSAIRTDPRIAVNGFTVVNNFEGAAMTNVDFSLPGAISGAVNSCMPFRVYSINMVNAPWVIRMVLPVFKAALSAKMADRLNIIESATDLPTALRISPSVLPVELGGEVELHSSEGIFELISTANVVV
jgi:hypothetical protein